MERDAGMNPRVLLVEDDPTSAAFLAAAAEDLPARVDIATSCAMARECVRRNRYDAWLFDANLPDGTGIDLLEDLRVDAANAGIPALAHTADPDPDMATALHLAGFSAVLVKPLAASAWRAAIRTLIPCPGEHPAKVWDDAAAVRALGAYTHVGAMRGLFLAELPAQARTIDVALASGDAESLRVQLHRLKASCGFVGAPTLASAVLGLSAGPNDDLAREAFRRAISDVLTVQPAPGVVRRGE